MVGRPASCWELGDQRPGGRGQSTPPDLTSGCKDQPTAMTSIARESKMDDRTTLLRIQADIADIKGDVANIKQALIFSPAILDRIEAHVAETTERAAHIIDQNDILVRWATDTGDDAAWPVALAGLTAVSDRLATVEQAAVMLPHIEAALAALAGSQQEMQRLFIDHDRHVAERVDRAATIPTAEVQRLRPFVFGAAALSLLVLAIHLAQFYQAALLAALGS